MNNIVDITRYIGGANTVRAAEKSVSLSGLIKTSVETPDWNVVANREAEPIKDIEVINRTVEFLLSRERYRDYLLFILGINFGLRASDLREVRFFHLIEQKECGELLFRSEFPVFEKKTRNTRSKKQNRYITINNAVKEAVTLYLTHTPGVNINDYLFCNISNNGQVLKEPLTVNGINYILKGIANDLNFDFRFTSHSLRKTFCYHQMRASHFSTKKLFLLQKMLGHSSPAQTLAYIGLTSDEMAASYSQLNLGGADCYDCRYIDSNYTECEIHTA